jgi:hypothetical protein
MPRPGDLIGAARRVSDALELGDRVAVNRPRATAASTVFVNLGDSEKQANIARDGVAVPVLPIDIRIIDEVVPIIPRFAPRVVSQSIPAGTRVASGATVEVVLASPFDLPTRIVPDTHVALSQTSLQQVFTSFVRDRDDVRAVLARNASPDTLSENDQVAIRNAFTANDLSVDEATPGSGIRNAFLSLQAAQTFNA